MQPTIPKPCLLLRPPLKLEWTTIYPLHDTTRPTVCVARALYLVTLAAYIRNPWTASMRRWSLRLPSEGMPCNCASSGYMHCLLSQCLQPACLVTLTGVRNGVAEQPYPCRLSKILYMSISEVFRLLSIVHEAAIDSAPLPGSHNGGVLQNAKWNLASRLANSPCIRIPGSCIRRSQTPSRFSHTITKLSRLCTRVH